MSNYEACLQIVQSVLKEEPVLGENYVISNGKLGICSASVLLNGEWFDISVSK